MGSELFCSKRNVIFLISFRNPNAFVDIKSVSCQIQESRPQKKKHYGP